MSNLNFRLEEKELDKINSNLLYITSAKYNGDWHSTAHTHHFTELFYVTRGNGKFLVEDDSFSVKANDLIIVNPNVTHTELGIPGTTFEYVVLGIQGLQFQPSESGQHFNYNKYNLSSYEKELQFCLHALINELRSKEDYYEAVCQNLYEILIYYIFRKTKTELSIASSKKITKECRFIEEYIDEHYTEDITLQTLSDLTFMNKYYLVHAFKKYKGTSPINYLIDKRIEESQHLLANTNYPVSKISDQIGFSSQSYFSQVFRKRTGLTPNQYRKSIENTREE